jgi:hypothetical protein
VRGVHDERKRERVCVCLVALQLAQFGKAGAQGLDRKGRFTIRPLVERTKDSSNLIGGEQKFVCWAFTLEANRQRPPNVYMAALFGSFGVKSLESLSTILIEIQTLLEQTNFSFQSYTNSIIYIF